MRQKFNSKRCAIQLSQSEFAIGHRSSLKLHTEHCLLEFVPLWSLRWVVPNKVIFTPLTRDFTKADHIIIQSGNYESIGIRYRRSQNLYISDVIEPL